MQTSGKHTTRQLREFRVSFLECADEVKDANPAEVRRKLLQKIPPFMKSWVIEAEAKKDERTPTVQLVAIPGMSEQNVSDSVKLLIKVAPKKFTFREMGFTSWYLVTPCMQGWRSHCTKEKLTIARTPSKCHG